MTDQVNDVEDIVEDDMMTDQVNDVEEIVEDDASGPSSSSNANIEVGVKRKTPSKSKFIDT